MRVDEFDYYFPPPNCTDALEKRSDSRLMVVNRRTGELKHRYFYQIGDFLTERLFGNQRYQSLPVGLFGEKTDTKAKSKCFCLGKSKKIPGKL